jgi:hypothetical protein
MALLKCGECGREVSTQAKRCPGCGAKVKKPIGPLGTILVVLLGVAVFVPLAMQERNQSGPSSAQTMRPPSGSPPVTTSSAKTTPNLKPERKPSKTSATHRNGICSEIKKVDLLLYENPQRHAPTTVCSYTDTRLLVKPNAALSKDRMNWFIFLAFSSVGALRNDDFMLPEKVYVGYAGTCQVMTTSDAAMLQETAKYQGDTGFLNAQMMASRAPIVACPQ